MYNIMSMLELVDLIQVFLLELSFNASDCVCWIKVPRNVLGYLFFCCICMGVAGTSSEVVRCA